MTDDTSAAVAQAMWDASPDYPDRAMIRMADRRMHGAEPPAAAAAAMAAADVIFGATRFSLYHSQARRDAVARGARFVNMADYRIGMLSSGGLFADFAAQGARMDRFAEAAEGRTIRVVTAAGTDLTASIEGRKAVRQYGRSLRPGSSSSPPDIEAALGPLEGTAEGVLVVDGSVPCPGLGVLRENIRVGIRQGRIVSVAGGGEAAILEQAMADLHDNDIYGVAEIGVGFNDRSALCGSMLEDEGAMGTLHVGFGSNLAFGGSVAGSNHLDMIIRDASVWVDGRQLIDNGTILIE